MFKKFAEQSKQVKKLLIKFLNKRIYIIIISEQGDKAASKAPNTDEKASKISDFF